MSDLTSILEGAKITVGTLEVFSHGFRITSRDPRVAVSCRNTLKQWAVYGEKVTFSKSGHRTVERVLQQTYGAALPKTGTIQNPEFSFCFHKGQFKDVMNDLLQFDLTAEDFNIVKIPLYEPADIKQFLKSTRIPRDYQEEAKDFALAPVKEGDHFSKLIGLGPGTGKSLVNGTLVQTPSGWTKIEELKIGDLVIGGDGKPTKVTGVYPQGVVDLYRVTFSDNRTATACSEHLWKVFSHSWDRDNGWKVVNTEQMAEYARRSMKKVFIPLVTPPDIPDKEFPLDPYLVGILLGDGGLSTPQIRFTKNHDYFHEVFDKSLPEGTIYKRRGKEWYLLPKVKGDFALRDKLTSLGMIGKRSWEKEIPEEYMSGSASQRLAIINGLLDTDGTIGIRGDGVSFTSTSEKLAKQFQSLVRSLGDMAYIKSRIIYYDSHGEKKAGRRSWSVFIRSKNPGQYFTLPSKRARVKNVNQYSNTLKLRVEFVEPIGFGEATCISVDNADKLFVIEDYVVTHNTLTLCYISSVVGKRTLIGVLKKYSEKWPEDLTTNLDISPKDIMPVLKTTQLRGLIDLCKTQGNEKLPNNIVITLSVLRGFIDKYEADPQDCIDDYGCSPYELWGLLGIGLFAIDEAHEHLNTVFKVSMYLHGPKFVALSGTMRTEDDFEEKIQQTIFPNIKRFLGLKPKAYNHLEFISYSFHRDQLKKIRFQAFGRSDYSHSTFEKSIVKNPRVLEDYLELQGILVDNGYMRSYQKGDVCGVYVGTVDMADKMVSFFKSKYPHLNVKRYCASEGDKYEDLMSCDLFVSTTQSAGTGVDIKGLVYLNFTTMVNSSKVNLQTLLRLREIEGRKTTCSMPYCSQNPKHVKYTDFRKQLFKDHAATMRTLNYNQSLG